MTREEWDTLTAWMSTYMQPGSAFYELSYMQVCQLALNDPSATRESLTKEQGREVARWLKAQV